MFTGSMARFDFVPAPKAPSNASEEVVARKVACSTSAGSHGGKTKAGDGQAEVM